MKILRIALAQMDFMLGDIRANTKKIIELALEARDTHKADLIVFPELSLTGYPPEDLIQRPEMPDLIQKAILEIRDNVSGIAMVIGHPHKIEDDLYNAASVLYDRVTLGQYFKQALPNYNVFDEKRYFTSGPEKPCIVTIKDVPIAIAICEDMWVPGPAEQIADAKAKLIISINASPFRSDKASIREEVMRERILQTGIPLAYNHWVGGQDEFVFDGGSMVMNADGELCDHAGFFNENLLVTEFEIGPILKPQKKHIPPYPHQLEMVYQALVLGTRDYVFKNGFPGALIGMSGGIDSALTAAIAADALGPENVECVMLPARHTSELSLTLSEECANLLKIKYDSISIEPVFKTFLESLSKPFKNYDIDITEQNIQARCRGVMLMALSNKFGKLLLTTGNKSEYAVGYSTLYGDMCGGFAVLKDVPKTLVYQLADYRNQLSPVIPQGIIDRPPSAELAPDQTDQDTLPSYDVLDKIIKAYVEEDSCIADIVKLGITEKTIREVVHKIDQSEYKRRQAPPGIRISKRAFGRDRRYPITSGFGENL